MTNKETLMDLKNQITVTEQNRAAQKKNKFELERKKSELQKIMASIDLATRISTGYAGNGKAANEYKQALQDNQEYQELLSELEKTEVSIFNADCIRREARIKIDALTREYDILFKFAE